MGQRGPAPTPSAVLKLRGTLRSDRTYNEPEPPPGTPECPDWLTPEAHEAWAQIAPDLVASGLLTRLDRNALARYCTLWVRWKACEQFIAEHGDVFTVKDGNGKSRGVKPFPQVAAAGRLAMALTKMEAEFGMTPSGRSRIHVDVSDRVKPPSGLAKFVRTG